jgi:hypothetical protein
MYHTQEKWAKKLTSPIKCVRDNAWLGEGFYFWDDLDFAHQWGKSSKKNTGEYEIYEAEIDTENVLNTVFNEEHYDFWLKQVEKVAKKIIKKTGTKPSIKEINEYFVERGEWNEVDGIMFQDIPMNMNYILVQGLWYKKRIQLVVYNEKIILNFSFYIDDKC